MKDRRILFKFWTKVMKKWPWYWGYDWIKRRRHNRYLKWKKQQENKREDNHE